VKGLVDTKLKLLGDEESTLQGLFIGVQVETKSVAVGYAVALPLNVEQDGEMLVLVFDQARYGELHAASFAANECR